jgi:hypothetical protein
MPAATSKIDPSMAWYLLGLTKGTIYTGLTIQSVSPMLTSVTTVLNLCLENVKYQSSNMITAANGIVQSSSAMMTLPLSLTAPGDFISYVSQGSDDYSVRLDDETLNALTLTLKDETGTVFTLADNLQNVEYNCVLRLDTCHREHSQESSLQQIVEYLRLIFLSSNINT